MKRFLYNCKIKKFRNGSKNICCCAVPIWSGSSDDNKDNLSLIDDFTLILPLDYDILGEPEQIKKDSVTRSDSVKRAIDSIFDLALNNDWNYFITFTFDPKKIDSYDYDKVSKSTNTWFNNARQRLGISYLAIPELHKSGRVHFHGLIKDNSGKFKDTLSDFQIDPKDGKMIYNTLKWRFGWSTVKETDNQKTRLARYVTKYMTKDLKKILNRMYWHSSDLLRPEIEYCNMDFQNFQVSEFSGFKYQFIQSDSEKVE